MLNEKVLYLFCCLPFDFRSVIAKHNYRFFFEFLRESESFNSFLGWAGNCVGSDIFCQRRIPPIRQSKTTIPPMIKIFPYFIPFNL